MRGESAEGARHGNEALRIAESLGHRYSMTYALMTLAYLHVEKGDFEEVAALCERGLALGREAGIAYFSSRLTSYLGYGKALSGAVDEGIVLLRKGIRDHEAMGLRTQLLRMRIYLAEGLLIHGCLDEAEVEARSVYAAAVARGEHWEEAMVSRLLGEIAARRNPQSDETPGNHYQRALSIAGEIGARPLAAHCHFSLGKLYRQAGKGEQAKEHLATATAMYREMGMAYWLERARTELR